MPVVISIIFVVIVISGIYLGNKFAKSRKKSYNEFVQTKKQRAPWNTVSNDREESTDEKH